MKFLHISNLISDEILDLRYQTGPEGDDGLSEFHTYFQLKTHGIVGFPVSDQGNVMEIEPENLAFNQDQFDSGQHFTDEVTNLVKGARVVDFYFEYRKNRLYFWQHSPFMELENGLFLRERYIGPVGLPTIGLQLMDRSGFDREIVEGDFRSWVKTQNDQ